MLEICALDAWMIWNVAVPHVHVITKSTSVPVVVKTGHAVIGYSARGRLKMEMPTTAKHKVAPLVPDLTPK